MSLKLKGAISKILIKKVKVLNTNLTAYCRKDHGPESYIVRLCRNTESRRILWNRDVNAAINILRLFLDWVEGRSKPPESCRAGQ